jgi:hypothetical protein
MGQAGIDASSVVVAKSGVAISMLDEDVLILDEQSGYCHSLNISAARIWALMKAPITVGAICEALCSEYEIDREACLRDVSELLLQMRVAGLMKIPDASAS